MSTLRNAEGAISGFFDRIFGRMFRGYVEPVELARKLAREMEDHKTVSVSRVYVPNEYVIYLSERDHGRFHSFESSLTSELGTYLAERARHEGFTLLSDPVIRIEMDRALSVGGYGIACRVVDVPAQAPDAESPDPDAGADPVDEPQARPRPVVDDPFSPFIAAVPVVAAAGDDEGDGDDPEAEHDAQPDVDPAAERDETPERVEDDLPADGGAEATPAVDADEVAELPAADEGILAMPAAEPEPDPQEALPPPPPDHDAWPRSVDIPGAPEPIAPLAPAAIVPPAPPVEPPAPARPLPPPGGYEPLAGVSGTQIFQSAEPDEPLLQEEVSLIIGGRRFRLTRRTTTLGRSRDCDIPVSDPNASRQHAEIRHIGLDYFLVDQNSTNGTYVNGQRVRRHALADGDRITIGTTEMIVEHVVMERG